MVLALVAELAAVPLVHAEFFSVFVGKIVSKTLVNLDRIGIAHEQAVAVLITVTPGRFGP